MKHIIMGTAGHIDHGKTSLIKALTNIDCDTHKEEKKRGITINLGFSYLNLPNGESIGIIDVPGHKDFINTMVGGACGIDFVLLVIAADSGIMPQTIEHINIINALGINKGIIALTKIDLVDDELIEMAKYEIHDFLEKTTLKNAPVIGFSSITEQGKDELIHAIEEIASQTQEKQSSNLFRMYIDRIFNVKGFGSVVTGSVLGGSMQIGKDVFLLPGNKQKLRVRSIERHGISVENVVAGDRAAINLIGLKNENFERGMIISDKQLETTTLIDAYVSIFDIEKSISLWSNVIFISGTYETQARMHLLNTDVIQPKENAIVQIHLNNQGILINQDKFIIRNSSGDITLGGGYVIDAAPLHHKKRTPSLIENLNNLSNNNNKEQNALGIIYIELKKEFKPFTPEEIAVKLNITLEELKAEILKEAANFVFYHTEELDILIDSSYDKVFRNKIIQILSEHHSKFQLFPNGLETNELLGKLGLTKIKTGRIYLDLLLIDMKKNQQIDKYQQTWILYNHKPIIEKQTLNEINWLENEILKYDTEKPVFSEIEEKAINNKIPKNKIKIYLTYLASIEKIKFFQNDFIHLSIFNKYRLKLLQQISDNEEIGLEINEFKELIGGTKRFRALLVDILESEKMIIIQRGAGVETTKFLITSLGKKYLHETIS